ncbi:hypothetical protein SKAU_G00251290 [Synaphobranchus kaupii]|uniref:Uncharacterized protein n=1 Tax=Synaphobranchus kaupii TaxID=118154 RepID=A0A9Q1IPU0_SYNKA|nr:hypothetical protein SKAU_G00251290 [Synaphobranchus kaupii]
MRGQPRASLSGITRLLPERGLAAAADRGSVRARESLSLPPVSGQGPGEIPLLCGEGCCFSAAGCLSPGSRALTARELSPRLTGTVMRRDRIIPGSSTGARLASLPKYTPTHAREEVGALHPTVRRRRRRKEAVLKMGSGRAGRENAVLTCVPMQPVASRISVSSLKKTSGGALAGTRAEPGQAL